ncbi:MAG TPA: NAD(P)H-quinone oxidoreductase [Bryobacteraceae bacterium]|jgi:putative PIG3 family NAD(P)H quinone oxidoreductase|nr:NAD(P)H-quinone oxidoreductase [Bryobacteraceae bacterium]
MIAIEISSFGGPDVLRPVERPKPVAKEGEVVIRVQAAGVSRADLMQRQGKYPPPPGASDIPGLDLAGFIDSVGPGVTDYKPGDAVCAIVAGGAYAEFCAAPVVQVLPVPQGWTAVEAATLPENLFTVYDNLITRAGLQPGESVLIHGGASGIGSMAIMLSRAWGAIPFATAGTQAKCDACRQLGAQEAINYKESDFVAEIKRLTCGHGADVIADLVGGSYLDRNLDALATEGRLAIIATQGGRTGQLDIPKLMIKRGRVLGSTMRARTPEMKGEIARTLLRHVWPRLPAKDPIRPVIDSTFPLTEARLAHERLEKGGHVGKVMLVV